MGLWKKDGPLACVRTFCFWTFQCELFIGVSFYSALCELTPQKGTWGAPGAHVSCPWVWSRVCCCKNSKNTSLPVRMVPWADLYSVVPGQAWRMVGMPHPYCHSNTKSLRHSSLFFSSLRYRFGPPYFCLLYSGDTHHSDNTICLVLKWMRSLKSLGSDSHGFRFQLSDSLVHKW